MIAPGGAAAGAPVGGAASRRSAWREVLLAFAVSRALFLLSATLLSYVLEHRDAQALAWPTCARFAELLRNALFNGDSAWYRTILERGYDEGPFRAGQLNWGFFPLYPLLVKALGGSLWAGVLLSNSCAVAGLLLVHRGLARVRGSAAATCAATLICFFPMSYVLSGFRPEGLFLATTAGAFVAAQERRFWLAGALAALAALTRVQGVFAAVFLLWELRRERRPALLLAAALPLCALLLFSLYEHRLTGSFFAWARVQETGWGHRPIWPNKLLLRELQNPLVFDRTALAIPAFSALVAAAALAACARLFSLRQHALAIYTLLGLLLPIAGGVTGGLPRYCATSFGLFLVWAGPRGRSARTDALLALSAGALVAIGALLGLGLTPVLA